MIGVYVHLPFCPYLCPYCDFAKWIGGSDLADRYLRALQCEIAATPSVPAGTVFLGGGTPNTYPARVIAELLERLRERFPGEAGRETTIELNPELVQPGDFGTYRLAGVTRCSIGVQSFNPTEMRRLRRRHTGEQVAHAIQAARDAEIGSVSIDLIFGVPGQEPASWRRSLEQAIALDVDHVSAYGLTVEPNTPYWDWRERDPRRFLDDRAEAELYGIAIEMLEAAGYEQYEISNFARPGHACKHNAGYWNNGEYAGLGVGAASFMGGTRSVNTRELGAYLQACESGSAIPCESEHLEGAARWGEAAMLALRTAQGVRFQEFRHRYGVDFLRFYEPIVTQHCEAGLLEVDTIAARLTRRGRFVANDVCADFVTFR